MIIGESIVSYKKKRKRIIGESIATLLQCIYMTSLFLFFNLYMNYDISINY